MSNELSDFPTQVRMTNERKLIEGERAEAIIAGAVKLRIAYRADAENGLDFNLVPANDTTVNDVIELLKAQVKIWASGPQQQDPIVLLHLLNESCEPVRYEYFKAALEDSIDLSLNVAAVILFLTSYDVVTPDINNCVCLWTTEGALASTALH